MRKWVRTKSPRSRVRPWLCRIAPPPGKQPRPIPPRQSANRPNSGLDLLLKLFRKFKI